MSQWSVSLALSLGIWQRARYELLIIVTKCLREAMEGRKGEGKEGREEGRKEGGAIEGGKEGRREGGIGYFWLTVQGDTVHHSG